MRQGGQLAGAAQLPRHPSQGGDAFLRLKLVGHRPAGELVRIAHLLPQGHVPHLDDHAVDEEVEAVPLRLNIADAALNPRKSRGSAQVRADLEAVLPQEVQHLRLGAVGRIFNGAHLVEKRVQVAGGRHGGVKV